MIEFIIVNKSPNFYFKYLANFSIVQFIVCWSGSEVIIIIIIIMVSNFFDFLNIVIHKIKH